MRPMESRGLWSRALRRALCEFLWIFVVVLDLGRRFGAVVLRAEYRRIGRCDKRGVCCEHILLEWPPWFDKHPRIARIILLRHLWLHRFFDRGFSWEVEDGLVVRVLGCHALSADRTCGQYRLRPLICRAYPPLPLIGRPPLLAGCGFRYVRRDGLGQPDSLADSLVSIGRRVRP